MRRTLVLALAAVALLGVVTSDALAQAPTPTFKINGLIDNVGSYSRNMSTPPGDSSIARNSDAKFIGRTRGVFNFEGTYGKTRGVLAIELDHYWGQTGSQDTNNQNCIAGANNATVGCATQGSGAEASFDINTDTQGNLQIKWLYTEFEVPLIPVPTTVRLGGQPFGSAANYKLATYANGDFGGVNIVSTVTPDVKLVFTYVAINEQLTGKKDIVPVNTVVQSQHDNFAFIFAPEFSVFKGLDIKPMYSYLFLGGIQAATPAGSVKAIAGGYPTTNGGPFAPATVSGADSTGTGIAENRHTIGVDARFRTGPFSIDPTVLYQFGNRNSFNTVTPAYGILCNTTSNAATNCPKDKADINAWLVDVRAGYQIGPLLLQGLFMWTSGNRAQDTLRHKVNYYQPLDTDASYLSDWELAVTSSHDIDYLNSRLRQGTDLRNFIGYDKYGRLELSLAATYALTPSLSLSAAVGQLWTDKSVDTDSVGTTAAGYLPSFVDRKTGRSARPEGDSRLIGTDLGAKLVWRFAPGLTFSFGGGYLFSGAALGHRHTTSVYCEAGKVNSASCQPPDRKDQQVNDVFIVATRVRFSF